MKEIENVDVFLNLVRELKKLWNKKVTVISVVVGEQAIVSKDFEKKTGGIRKSEKKSRPSIPQRC